MLSEVSQVQKDKGCLFSFLYLEDRVKYKYKNYHIDNICIQNSFSIVGLLKEIRNEGKKERMIEHE
jgi:hypothetical protein